MFRRYLLGLILCLTLTTACTAPMISPPAHAAAAQIIHVDGPAAHPAAFLDKTRVVLHLAVAYGVFHHWVYKPFRAGDISIHHPVKLVKAGLALLFAVHEIKVAYGITSTSSSPTLRKLNSVLSLSIKKFTSIGDRFHKDPASLTSNVVSGNINDLNNQVNQSNAIMSVPDAPVSQLGTFS